MKIKLSLGKSNLRSQISASYALMAVIPILGLGYLIWAYMDPDILSQQNVIVVIFVVVAISLLGFTILRQVVRALSDFREHLNSVVQDRVLDTPISADEPTDKPTPESLEDIVYNLIKHNSRLSDMFAEMEELTWKKTRELTRLNLEFQRETKKNKAVEASLRQSNMQLSDALTKLKELQQCIIRHERLSALGQLASGIAHDINNALMPVVGFAELILEDKTIINDKTILKKMLVDILAGAKQATTVVGKLKSFYRRDGSLNFTDIDCNQLINEVCELTKPRWAEGMAAQGKRIEVKTNIKDTPSLKADARLLTDALVNITLNATDALPTGGIITLTVAEKDGSAIFTVQDNGLGMDEHTRDRCMEPFFTTKGPQATGMGLAIAYGSVRRHAGHIEIASQPGHGTTVTISLPLQMNEEQIPAHDPGTAPQLRPLKILVIDDEANARSALETILKPGEHQITLATNGSEGLKIGLESDFDVIITDRAMPDMSGDEVALAISEQKPDLPIIMVTGFGEMMKEQHHKPVGVARIISKPVESLTLRWALSDLTQ